jgi:hypothetical protein
MGAAVAVAACVLALVWKLAADRAGLNLELAGREEGEDEATANLPLLARHGDDALLSDRHCPSERVRREEGSRAGIFDGGQDSPRRSTVGDGDAPGRMVVCSAW